MLHQLGVGTLGPVLLASDDVLGVTAAVKLIELEATTDQRAALVQRVNAAAASQPPHPGLVKLIEAGLAGNLPYVAMEYVEGPSLDVRLRERDAALPAGALGWLETLAAAIDAMHAAGLDHGSLHPRDVYVTPDGARLSGCGIARAVEAVGLRAPVRLPYTAPERAAGPSWGHPADIFSFAALAFECLAGARPSGTGRVAADRLPPTISPQYDRALRDVFARALSGDAGRRPGTAQAVVQALMEAGAGAAYGGQVKRVAVHHRGVVAPPVSVRSDGDDAGRGAPSGGAADDADLARFASEGVLPASTRRGRGRSRSRAAAGRVSAPEPRDDADPLTLFQPEPDEPHEPEPVDRAAAAIEPPPDDETRTPEDPPQEPRAEGEGWLASAPAVPLVDLHDDAEPSAAVELGADASVGRFASIDLLADQGTTPRRDEGPRELGTDDWDDRPTSSWHEAPTEAAAAAAPAIERPYGSDPSVHAGPAAATLFGGEDDDWDEPVRERRRVGLVVPLLLVLLAAGLVAWYYLAREAREVPAVGTVAEEGASAGGSDAGPPPVTEPGAPAAPDQASTPAAPAPPRDQAPPAQAEPVVVDPAPSARAAADRVAEPSAADPQSATTPAAETRVDQGRLLVRTSPSAEVTVDGEPHGTSPVALYALDWGPYTVVVRRPGYVEETRRIMITPDQPAAALTIELGAAGAADSRQATTPTAPVAQAPREPEGTAGPDASSTPAATGTLLTVTRPAGARVSVDGRAAGTTPAAIAEVPSGRRVVRFDLEGYQAWETTVTVRAGERLRVAASLERDP